jgi:hypothetical protein
MAERRTRDQKEKISASGLSLLRYSLYRGFQKNDDNITSEIPPGSAEASRIAPLEFSIGQTKEQAFLPTTTDNNNRQQTAMPN